MTDEMAARFDALAQSPSPFGDARPVSYWRDMVSASRKHCEQYSGSKATDWSMRLIELEALEGMAAMAAEEPLDICAMRKKMFP